MKRILRHYFPPGAVALGVLVFLSACGTDGYQGSVFERLPDGGIGPVIAGAEITFVSEDGTIIRQATSSALGTYRRFLDPARYIVSATHLAHEDFSTAPGFFVVTGDGLQTGNIFMARKAATIALVVRHAERQSNAANTNLDPDQQNVGIGVNRAEALVEVAVSAGISGVYTTEFCRTAQTGQPSALELGLALRVQQSANPDAAINACAPLITAPLDLLPAQNNTSAELAEEVLSANASEVVLIVGHSNTVPRIVESLGADALCPAYFPLGANNACNLPGNEFHHLFIVTVPNGPGPVELVKDAYGPTP